ncbi:DMT family transporter [Paenibacillus oleatilyticus]|uniref:DMT family transporter n=1 Tax=Paenibacillus oleatilyticus TaxID=2594886 RepID=UPI001C200027|nr:DMT family transporter [Paenibacillus oleatilyticus]MBU7314549.1 DMT family transporter [Paenibacillus oleatilyticus]
MNGMLLGLVSALSFGTADFFAGKSSKKIGVFSTLFYMQLVGLLFLTAAVFWKGQWPALLSLRHAAAASLWMAVDLIGILFLYQGLLTGSAAVVAPIASSFSVVTVVLAFLSGERLGTGTWLGIGITLSGVISASMVWSGKSKQRSRTALASGVLWAILASLFLGAAFFGLRFAQEALGGLLPVWIGRLQATILLPVLYRLLKIKLTPPGRNGAGLVAIVGILDAVALVSYNTGLGLEDTSIVITATSLFAIVTLLWGVLAGGEKPAWTQWIGVGCTLAGILIVSWP